MDMRIAVASDHAGFRLKEVVVPELQSQGFTVLDLGQNDESPGDYPDVARRVAEAIIGGRADRGIALCGSGIGVSVAANKFPGIYAGVCHDTYSAHQSVEHDNANVLCLGQRIVGLELAREIIRAFVAAEFSREERHVRRLDKVKAIEAEHLKPPGGK
jgi:ribose 5-phosphate isomerase B